ncbi:MAG: F0F1 ATP synthase subunit epsilon [Dehalococcoidia bacterium]|jgi:F-type H+-transporting ATPase subunit epsilon
MPKLNVDIVTAERVVFSEDDVDLLVVPGIEGELGVLPLHAPLLTTIKPGVLRVVKGEEETTMAITGGFIEVRENRVTILADAAERGEEIDAARAEAARRLAEERLASREATIDMVQAEMALKRALVRLKALEQTRRRRRGAPPPPS